MLFAICLPHPTPAPPRGAFFRCRQGEPHPLHYASLLYSGAQQRVVDKMSGTIVRAPNKLRPVRGRFAPDRGVAQGVCERGAVVADQSRTQRPALPGRRPGGTGGGNRPGDRRRCLSPSLSAVLRVANSTCRVTLAYLTCTCFRGVLCMRTWRKSTGSPWHAAFRPRHVPISRSLRRLAGGRSRKRPYNSLTTGTIDSGSLIPDI